MHSESNIPCGQLTNDDPNEMAGMHAEEGHMSVLHWCMCVSIIIGASVARPPTGSWLSTYNVLQ